jgi:hypothetical protein
MYNFKEGDTVCPVTNPDDVMTVCSVFGRRLVECYWIGKEGRLYKNSFRPESLKLVTAEQPMSNQQQNTFISISAVDEEDEFTL